MSELPWVMATAALRDEAFSLKELKSGDPYTRVNANPIDTALCECKY